MKILFYDTETTGKPKEYGKSAIEVYNWPRIVQLATILVDFDRETGDYKTEERSCVIKPNGWIIEQGAMNIHGITNEFATQNGVDIEVPLQYMKKVFNSGIDLQVCHNTDFDRPVLGAEFYRAKEQDWTNLVPIFCTMKKSTSILKLPPKFKRFNNYKWPSLQELHFFCFGKHFDDSHDALNDVRATLACYIRMIELGYW